MLNNQNKVHRLMQDSPPAVDSLGEGAGEEGEEEEGGEKSPVLLPDMTKPVYR